MLAATDQLQHVSAKSLSSLMDVLTREFGNRACDNLAVREHHSEDEAYHRALPDIVVFPKNAEEVSRIVTLCAEFNCPITAWGAGTSLEGNALCISGGVCLDLSRMNNIIALHAEDMTVTVEAGVTRNQLNNSLRHSGLFFPIDPGADATLGGMAATRASGTNAVKYGTMRGNVLCCTAVLANGNIIKTGRRSPKSAAGYDLTALLVGSEGTLGIITDLTVRLHPVPEYITSMTCVFCTIDDAVQTAILAIQCALGVARIELLDAKMMAAINSFEKSDYPIQPTLFVEFHGSELVVEVQTNQFIEIAESFGGRRTAAATTTEERKQLWKARHNALYASRAMEPTKKALITDVCVPISRLADCVAAARIDLDNSPLTATIAGHVGDGNFHAFILFDPTNSAEVMIAEALHQGMAKRAIAMGGTCTGEHGIGVGKRELLIDEAGASVDAMRMIKMALDPMGILNPNKIFVDQHSISGAS